SSRSRHFLKRAFPWRRLYYRGLHRGRLSNSCSLEIGSEFGSHYGAPWLVLRGLDRDATCAPELVAKLLPKPGRLMCFRIAVRAVEAWLLSDREQVSRSLGLSRNRIPTDSEQLENPKGDLVSLARLSRFRAIREDMVPAAGTTAQVGPAYTSRIIEFARSLWR